MDQETLPRLDFDHVPVSFFSFFHQQITEWETLFPAERSYLHRLSSYLEKVDAKFFDGLREVEKQMGVTPQTWPRGKFTLQQVDFLNRNAHYPAWRAEVARLFSIIDPALEREVRQQRLRRLIIQIAPADLPVGPDRMWTRFKDKGRRLPIAPPENVDHYLPQLLQGNGTSLAEIADARAPYASWIIEAGSGLQSAAGKSVVLSYEALHDYRLRLMSEVQKITADRNIRGPRQLGEKLKTLRLQEAESQSAKDAPIAEFLRATLLAGNGTLLLNNTFVEWAAVQALRRARPHLLIASFGIRNKVKPFSGLLIFNDQNTATQIPTQADMLGSYVDLEVFYQYIWQETEKYAEYLDGTTAHLLVAQGMDEMLSIGAEMKLPYLENGARYSLPTIHAAAREWLAATA